MTGLSLAPAGTRRGSSLITTIPEGLRLDLLYAGLLLVLTAMLLLPAVLTAPMELWDESRNANNAQEMVKRGVWLVTTYGYVPDHWNTKPPLFIWIVASLLRGGMEPMLAIRLPSVVATLGIVLLIYTACRVIVRDRLSGLLAGLALIGSALFMGDHVARTGDFDALLSFLNLGFVLCVGQYIDRVPDRAGRWIAAGAVLLFLAVMTKGAAGGLAVPGLAAYALIRGQLGTVLADWRPWVSVAAVFAALAGWLATREWLDPGYAAALWHNDIGGRMLTVLDQHAEGPFYYLELLVTGFLPALALLPALAFVWRDGDPARRRLCSLTIVTAVSWLLALSCARTKLYWYVAPVIPLLAIAVGTAAAGFLHTADTAFKRGLILWPFTLAVLLSTAVSTLSAGGGNSSGQDGYGDFLREVRGTVKLDGAVILDAGFPNAAGFTQYNPIAQFFARDAERHGEHIRLAAPGELIAGNTTIISCDALVRDWLRARDALPVLHATARCVIGRTLSPITAGPWNPG